MTAARKTGGLCYFGFAAAGCEQFLRSSNAAFCQIPVGCVAGAVAKHPGEIEPAEIRFTSQILQPERRAEPRLNQFADSFQNRTWKAAFWRILSGRSNSEMVRQVKAQ